MALEAPRPECLTDHPAQQHSQHSDAERLCHFAYNCSRRSVRRWTKTQLVTKALALTLRASHHPRLNIEANERPKSNSRCAHAHYPQLLSHKWAGSRGANETSCSQCDHEGSGDIPRPRDLLLPRRQGSGEVPEGAMELPAEVGGRHSERSSVDLHLRELTPRLLLPRRTEIWRGRSFRRSCKSSSSPSALPL